MAHLFGQKKNRGHGVFQRILTETNLRLFGSVQRYRKLGIVVLIGVILFPLQDNHLLALTMKGLQQELLGKGKRMTNA